MMDRWISALRSINPAETIIRIASQLPFDCSRGFCFAKLFTVDTECEIVCARDDSLSAYFQKDINCVLQVLQVPLDAPQAIPQLGRGPFEFRRGSALVQLPPAQVQATGLV